MTKYAHVIIYLFSLALTAVLVYLNLPVSTHTAYPTPFGLSYAFSTYSAGLAVGYFYLSLLISPLYHVFHKLPGRGAAIFSRKSLGLTAFMFGAFHGLFIIFSARGGIVSTIQKTTLSNQIGYWTGIIAILIFIILAITSNDTLRGHLGTMWKKIQQYSYLAGILVIAHVLFITTHLGKNIPMLSAISFGLLSILLTLESVRFEDFVRSKHQNFPKWVITIVGSLGSIALLWWLFLIMPHPAA